MIKKTIDLDSAIQETRQGFNQIAQAAQLEDPLKRQMSVAAIVAAD